MSADVIQFVDSIDASPTVLLDVNLDLNPWICRLITANPPRLRRAMSSNAMRDGVFVSSSQYEARTVLLDLEVLDTTQDLGAAQLQALARVLDRDDVFLKWQPNGASKPVFFKLYRSDISAIRDIQVSSRAYRAVQVELLAEPFALGLRETLGPFTVNNDPAAGSNGCYFDVTGVIGDVEARCIMVNTSRRSGGLLAVRQHGTPADLQWWSQAESLTLHTDTTNPGGGPDAAMSGAGTNNFVRTSFATDATMVTRLSWDLSAFTADQRLALRGTYRVMVMLRRSGAVSAMSARVDSGQTVTIPASANRQLVDLGLLSLGVGNKTQTGPGANPSPYLAESHFIQAARTSGAETLDFDAVFLIPADEQTLRWDATTTSTGNDLVIDSYAEDIRVYSNGADIFAGTGSYDNSTFPMSGGFPELVPNQTNRFYFIDLAAGSPDVTSTNVITVYYWPHYLYVRPSAS